MLGRVQVRSYDMAAAGAQEKKENCTLGTQWALAPRNESDLGGNQNGSFLDKHAPTPSRLTGPGSWALLTLKRGRFVEAGLLLLPVGPGLPRCWCTHIPLSFPKGNRNALRRHGFQTLGR